MKTPRVFSDTFETVLEPLLQKYRNPAMATIRLGTSNLRESSCNLMGCYLQDVHCSGLVLKNGFNQYDGRNEPVDNFEMSFRFYVRKMGKKNAEVILEKLGNLISQVKGLCCTDASLLFVFEQESEEPLQPAQLYFVDSQKKFYKSDTTDGKEVLPAINTETSGGKEVLTAIKHIHYIVKDEWYTESTKPVTIYLVRHGERHDYVDLNWPKSAPHPHDSPLSAAGHRQAEDIADRLCHLNPHLIVSAPMQRAIQSAIPLARRLHKKISVENGIFEFLDVNTRKRVPSLFSNEVSISPWVDSNYTSFWSEINLEAWSTVHIRATKTIRFLIEECRGKGDLVVVGHRSTLQPVFKDLLPDDFGGDTKLEYGGIAMLVECENGKFDMLTFNELAHLRDRVTSPPVNPHKGTDVYSDVCWDNYVSTSMMQVK